MEMKKAIGIIAGVGAGAFVVALIIGYFAFDDSADVRKLKEDLAAAKQAGDDAVKKVRAELDGTIKDLEGKNKQLADDLDKARKEMSSKVADLDSQLNMARTSAETDKQRLQGDIERLTEQVKQLQAQQIKGPQLPTLIDRLNKVWPAYIGFSVRALELKNALALARIAPPDLAAINKYTNDIIEASKVYSEQSKEVLQHVRLVRGELSKVGIEPDTLERKFSPELERTTKQLSEIVKGIAEKVVSREVAVDAAVDFTDVGIKAEPGDLVFFSVTGSWQMSSELPVGNQDGWPDIPNHLKVEPKLQGGALICKVGVSQNVLPAYGKMPVVVEEEGLLRLGINDKRLDDNIGRLTVTAVRIPGAQLSAFEEFWNKKLERLVY